LPDYKDSFSWSVPFIAEKICDMFIQLMNITDSSKQSVLTKDEEKEFTKLIQSGSLNKFLIDEDIEEPPSAGLH